MTCTKILIFRKNAKSRKNNLLHHFDPKCIQKWNFHFCTIFLNFSKKIFQENVPNQCEKQCRNIPYTKTMPKWLKIVFCIFWFLAPYRVDPVSPDLPWAQSREGRFLFCRPGDLERRGDRGGPGRLACFENCRFDSALSRNSIRTSKSDLDQKLQPKQIFDHFWKIKK